MRLETGKGVDLRERTFEFACAIVSTHRRIYRVAPDLRDVSRQAMRAGTAIGASLEEADAAQSRADFVSKCTIALKEARECRYWMRILHRVEKTEKASIETMGAEATELIAILTTIVKKSRR
jgi:four helix bundle protein